MRTLPTSGARHGGLVPPWRTLLLTCLALGLHLLAGPAPEAWVYDRASIRAGELWRLLTGHLVHADGSHALWDIVALLLLGTLLERRLGPWFTVSLAASVVSIDVWLWWGMPALERYCGLSGILNSLLATGLYELWRERREPLVVLIGVGAAAKIAVELLFGQALLTNTVWPSVPAVHGVGFVTGLAVAAAQRSLRTVNKPWMVLSR